MKKIFLSFPVFLLFCQVTIAQATATFTASVTILEPIQVKNTAPLNFAHIYAGKGGSVTLTPSGVRMIDGIVVLADGGNISAAAFVVSGAPGLSFSLSIPKKDYILSNGEDRIIIKDFTSIIEGSPKFTDSTKIIKLGATLEIEENQTPGIYRNVEKMAITVNYN